MNRRAAAGVRGDDDRPAGRGAVVRRTGSGHGLEGLEQEFNLLDAQREACEAFVASRRGEGWDLLPDRYDDGGYSGGNTDRVGRNDPSSALHVASS